MRANQDRLTNVRLLLKTKENQNDPWCLETFFFPQKISYPGPKSLSERQLGKIVVSVAKAT